MRFRLVVDGEAHDIEVTGRRGARRVTVDGVAYPARVDRRIGALRVTVRSTSHRIEVRGLRVFVDGVETDLSVRRLAPEGEAAAGREAGPTGVFEIRPPMPGRVVRLAIAVGERVRRGQPLVVLEAMKMQNEISAPANAVVREVHVREGETIGADRLIAVLEAL